MALTQISTQGIKDGTITGSDLATNVDLVDDQKLRFGTGNDLEIYGIASDGTAAIINHANGDLLIKHGADKQLISRDDGAIELYHDDNKKLETLTDGVLVTGKVAATGDLALTSSDGQKIRIGQSNDLQIYHDGTNNYIEGNNQKTIIRNTSNNIHLQAVSGEAGIDILPNSAVKLYHNGNQKLETSSVGVNVTGNFNVNDGIVVLTHSTPIIKFEDNSGSSGNDFAIQVNGNAFKIVDTDNSDRVGFQFGSDGNTSLGGNVTINGSIFLNTHLDMGDSDVIKLGASDDLQIYHDGTHSRIYNSTGDLVLGSPNTIAIKTTNGSENMITAINNGAVNLFYDNSKKFETTSTGAKVSGRFEQFGNSTGNNQTNTGFARNLYNVEIAHNTTKTFTFTGLNGGWATIKMGGYSSNGGSAMSFRAELGGWMFYTSTANYGSTEPQNHTHNVSTSVTKNATSYVVSVTNNASNSATLGVNLCTEATQTAFSVAIS